MSLERYGGPFDRCLSNCFNYCRCYDGSFFDRGYGGYDESDQEAYSGESCREPSSDSRAGLSEAFLAAGRKSPEASDDSDGRGGLSEAFLAAGSKSPDAWGGRDGRGGLSEAFFAAGSKSPEKIWDDWADGATSNSTAIPRAPVVATAPKERGDSRAGLSEAFLAAGSKSPEKIWDDWADGATSSSTAIPRAPAVASAPKEWGDSGGSTSHSMSIPPALTLTDVTLADGGRAFDCSACCLPLKPPIFQRDVAQELHKSAQHYAG